MTINQSLAVPSRGNQFKGSVRWERDEEVPYKGVNRKMDNRGSNIIMTLLITY